ncbi:MAG: hypothetical protein AAF525_08710 [Pseudomonadota bacterium]
MRERLRGQPRILIYTDSRGYDITGVTHHRNPFTSYMRDLVHHYDVDCQIVPAFSTTLIDFLSYYRQADQAFDLVVLHCGIVDFSRRPRSWVEAFYREKDQSVIHDLWDEDTIATHLATDTGYHYEGEPTRSFYSQPMADAIIEQLQQIPQLIWIGCHGIVSDWRGNYWKERPEDLPVIVDYSRRFSARLPGLLDIEDWTDDEIMANSYDNIHLNKAGLGLVQSLLNEAVAHHLG